MNDAPDGHRHEPRAGCPLCGFFETIEGAQPEATEHLANAVREFIRAGRTVLDAAESALERHYPEGGAPAREDERGGAPDDAESGSATRVRRIDIA